MYYRYKDLIKLASMLDRFKDAQKNSYSAALREVKAGKKRTHWMWYIFPQIKGLGKTSFLYDFICIY